PGRLPPGSFALAAGQAGGAGGALVDAHAAGAAGHLPEMAAGLVVAADVGLGGAGGVVGGGVGVALVGAVAAADRAVFAGVLHVDAAQAAGAALVVAAVVGGTIQIGHGTYTSALSMPRPARKMRRPRKKSARRAGRLPGGGRLGGIYRQLSCCRRGCGSPR